MQFRETSPGLYRADDESTIIFNTDKPPTHARAVIMGHAHEQSVTRLIELGKFMAVRTVHCGRRAHQGGPGAAWSSNTVYTIYVADQHSPSRTCAMIASVDGFGPRFFLVSQLDAAPSVVTMAEQLPAVVVWDLCRALVGSYEQGERMGRRRGTQDTLRAHAERRIQKRTRDGVSTYTVKPPPPVMHDDGQGGQYTVIRIAGDVPGVDPLVTDDRADASAPTATAPSFAGASAVGGNPARA